MAVVYVAQPGDSISKILQRAGGSWLQEDWRNRVMQINPHIKDPNRIDINQLILVPESPNEIILQERVDYVSRVKNALNDSFLRREIERFAKAEEEASRRKEFFATLDKIPGMHGAGVVFVDSKEKPVIIRNPTGYPKKTLIVRETPKIVETEPVDDRFLNEITGTILSCSAAVLGVVAIFGGSALVPFSGGTSTALVYLAYAATTASAVQCGMGIYRTAKIHQGETSTVDWLDSQEWYLYASMTLDGISIAGGVGATAASVKTALALKRAAPTKSWWQILKGMQRAERKRLAEDLARINNPGISNKALKEMVRSGMIPKRYAQTQITQSARTQIIELFGAGASMIGSGLNGVINKVGTSVSIILLQEAPE